MVVYFVLWTDYKGIYSMLTMQTASYHDPVANLGKVAQSLHREQVGPAEGLAANNVGTT